MANDTTTNRNAAKEAAMPMILCPEVFAPIADTRPSDVEFVFGEFDEAVTDFYPVSDKARSIVCFKMGADVESFSIKKSMTDETIRDLQNMGLKVTRR